MELITHEYSPIGFNNSLKTVSFECSRRLNFEAAAKPLPHVLILTAIVVGVATSALGLALVLQIYKNYNTIEEKEIEAEELKSER